MSNRYLLSAGSNARGQLAIDLLDDVHKFTPAIFRDCPRHSLPPDTTRVVDIACGANFTLALLEVMYPTGTHRELWACGDGSRGQLGSLYSREQPTLQLVPIDLRLSDHGLGGYAVYAIAAGWETSYVILSSAGQDDVLISLGSNDFGDLGTGNTQTRVLDFGRVHEVNLRHCLEAGPDSRLSVHSVVAGTHHVIAHCAVVSSDSLSRNAVVGWGASRHGQLGAAGRSLPFQPFPILLHPTTFETFIATAAGSQHSVLLRKDHSLLTIGSNRKSQIARLDTLVDVSSVRCTWNGTYAILDQNRVWSVIATGDSTKGQLGCDLDHDQPNVANTVQFPFSHDTHRLLKLACGSEHVLCLFSLHDTAGDANPSSTPSRTEVWGWGWNEHGNIGLGHTNDVFLPTRVWPASGDSDSGRVIDLWAGCGTSWILVDNVRS